MIYSLFFFIIGAAFGSFSLVLAWRTYAKKDWVKDRSKCDHCFHELQPVDLVPVVSWLALRGRCRYCNKRLPKTLILSELLMALVFLLSWHQFSSSYQGESLPVLAGLLSAWLIAAVILNALFWYDLRWQKLPTKLIIPVLALAIVYCAFLMPVDGFSTYQDVLLPIASAALLSGLFAGLFFISNGKWIGFGDVRLALPLGLFLGNPLNTWLMLFMASVLGILVALPGVVGKNRKLSSKIPFGPLLIFATWAVVLYGDVLIEKYTSILGL